MATFHREHERYYTADNIQAAAELYREANKLRIVAADWQRTTIVPPLDGVDLQQPAYEAAGCVDLSDPSSVAAIGVLFMEGGAAPSELRVLAAKLAGLATGWTMAGRWLADKMTAAWTREQSLFTPQLIGVAQARFETIAVNWRGSRELQLAGQLVSFAHDRLQRMDLRPAAIRARRADAAHELLQVAAIIAMAAQLKARIGADLADNDRNWTAYLDGLPG